jgi:hypothetical protein
MVSATANVQALPRNVVADGTARRLAPDWLIQARKVKHSTTCVFTLGGRWFSSLTACVRDFTQDAAHLSPVIQSNARPFDGQDPTIPSLLNTYLNAALSTRRV